MSKSEDSSTNRTLYIKDPCGQTLGLAAILFVLLVALGEVLVRTHVFQAHVVASSRGGRHQQFEDQLGRLETVVARDGPIDCIFLGNSQAWFGFDPEVFAQAYRRQTGQDIRCFNFGVAGMPTVVAGALAPILVDNYQPSLLIYGTTARDYAVGKESEEATVLLDMPWLRYRLGEVSIQGWFYDHSRLYQYWETLGHLLQLKDRSLLLTGWYASGKWNYGFGGREEIKIPVSMPPDRQSEEPRIQVLLGWLDEYKLLSENLSGLEQVIAQNGPDVQVLIVEMPVPPTYRHFFGNGEQDYQQFIDHVEGIAESRAIPFWRTTPLGLISDDGWWDYGHLNAQGAQAFSKWLGEQLGNAVLQGRLENPVTTR